MLHRRSAILALCVIVVTSAGCSSGAATNTAAGAETGTASAASPTTAGGGAPAGHPVAPTPGGGLVDDDPSRTVIQPFPTGGSCHARPLPAGTLPDPVCTPGATDPHVTADTLDTTICRPGGYTSTVRPPQSVTDPEKRLSMTSYGAPGSASQYEFDHLVPLSVGGSPNSPRNLWPQPGASPNPKDKLEGALQDLVCARKLPLRDAQHLIATDWAAAYRQILGTDPPR